MPFDAQSLQRAPGGAWTLPVPLPGVAAGATLHFPSGDDPSPGERHALAQLVDGWAGLHDELQRALFAFYCASEAAASDAGPALQAEDEVWAHVAIQLLEIQADGRAHLVGVCSWESERGLEIGVREGHTLTYVGPYEGLALQDPPPAHLRNFADPAHQALALAEGQPSEDELAQLARSYVGTAGDAAVPRSKPWWRFW